MTTYRIICTDSDGDRFTIGRGYVTLVDAIHAIYQYVGSHSSYIHWITQTIEPFFFDFVDDEEGWAGMTFRIRSE